MDKSGYLKIGLSSEEALKRQLALGLNELEGERPPSDWNFIARQFKNPLVLVLVVAGLVTLFLQEYTDATVIGLAVMVNTVLGFIQERNAQRGLESLKKVLTPQALVIRNGEQNQIDARNLVAGDVVLLYEGDKVPADGVVVESRDLLVNEALLTGESVTVIKNAVFGSKKPVVGIQNGIPENDTVDEQKVFMGTVVAKGSGVMVVTKIGMQTEIGKIAESLEGEQDKETPLERRLSQLARWLTLVVLLTVTVVFIYGLLIVRMSLDEIFKLTVALAVAAIPEGMVVSLTVILAIGMQRILKKKALVRKMVSAETLGTVTVVCVDKTGTLTEGKLQVVESKFVDELLGLRASALANDLRDGTELARWSWLREMARKSSNFKVKSSKLQTTRSVTSIPDPQVWLDEYPRDDAIAFSSEFKFMATRHGKEIFVVGAPEVVFEWTSKVKISKLKVQSLIEEWGSKGRRMVGMAYVEAQSLQKAQQLFDLLKNHEFEKVNLKWLGLVGYADPVRQGVKQSLLQAKRAGISVKVITGDYRPTAVSVLQELEINLSDGAVMEGFELEKLSDDELKNRISDIVLFARTKPNQKMRIVKALKMRGEVVAMMGDGVNDAPALAAADIGIVVGESSEVARESADMVLLDSNFKTILDAVAEGRGIFDNLRKIVLYLLSDVFTETILVLGSLIAGWPLAITAVQILWVNLVGDGLPNLALTVDPRSRDVLKRKPVDSSMPLITNDMLLIMVVIGLATGLAGLAVFRWAYPAFGVVVGQTMAFQVLGIGSFWYVYSCRMLSRNVWEEPIWTNKWLVGATVLGLVLMIGPVYIPVLRALLGVEPLSIWQWSVVFLTGMTVIGSVEVAKIAYKKFISLR